MSGHNFLEDHIIFFLFLTEKGFWGLVGEPKLVKHTKSNYNQIRYQPVRHLTFRPTIINLNIMWNRNKLKHNNQVKCLVPLCNQNQHNLLKNSKAIKFITRIKADCVTASKERLSISFSCVLHLKIEHCIWNFTFLEVPKLSCPLILGSDLISKMGLLLDLSERKFYFKFDRSIVFCLIKFINR